MNSGSTEDLLLPKEAKVTINIKINENVTFSIKILERNQQSPLCSSGK
ncbi:MAG: hypothetical protein IPO14_01685 [Saprospiraceae bacterium]|nr:hypothetical protein [Saprospiraceae bacterium]